MTLTNERRGTPPVLLLALCVWCSGLCALIYQTIWLREFRFVFGASTAASAAVLAIFMGGLGAGSIALGKKADRLGNPFRFYGQLELFIALSAALTPLLLALVRQAYVAVGGTPALGLWPGTALRLLLATLVLLGPTFLMGGTLPALVSAAQAAADQRRRQVAVLYGVNTLGAVTGVLFATFFLIERLGDRLTLWAACALNLAVALVALRLARRLGVLAASDNASTSLRPTETSPVEPAEVETASLSAPPAFILGAAALAGFAFFLMELVWYRMLGPLLGGSTFTFGLILAMALLGIALGSLGYSRMRGRGQVTLTGFAAVSALEALFIVLPYALGDRLALLTIVLQPLGTLGFAARVAQWSFVTFIVVFPASVAAGMQFPMLIALLGQGNKSVGAHTGLAYGWNTAGAIAGSLAGGFGLLPVLTAPGAWQLVTVLLVVLACVALGLAARRQPRWLPSLPALAMSATALLLLTALGPTAAWRHSPIGAGRVEFKSASRNEQRSFFHDRRRKVVWEAEGVESSLGLLNENGYGFLVNGKADGHARDDAPTQVMAGLLGALIHPEPRRSLVVGLGTGSTAGWLGVVPTMERVDVVELEPAIQRVAEYCAPVNHNVLANPKVHVWYGDAREVLLTSRQQYDLIASEPSNPYRAGVASLFTREFYEAAARRLRAGGLFVQWVQAYEVDGATISTVYATLAAVFPVVETWESELGDLVLIASAQPIRYDVNALRRRLGEEPFKSGVALVWRMTDLEGVFARYIANRKLALAVAAQDLAVCTDDRNLLEFGFARMVGRQTGFNNEVLRQAAKEEGYHWPELTGGELNWDRMLDRRASAVVLDSQRDFGVNTTNNAIRDRTRAKAAYARDDLAGALHWWQHQSQEPGDLIELLLVARCLADCGDDRAPGYIEQLRGWFPAEADALLAQYCWHKGRAREGLELAVRSFSAFRNDPWSLSSVIEPTLNLSLKFAKQPGEEEQAARLLQALQTPFALRLLETERGLARLELTWHLDQVQRSHLTRSLLAEMEQNVPWTRTFLRLRASGYSRAADPRAVRAASDLAEFESYEARPFVFSTRQELVEAEGRDTAPSMLSLWGSQVHAREKPAPDNAPLSRRSRR